MTLVDGHTEYAGWIVHVQAAVDADPHGYDAPAAKYGTSQSTNLLTANQASATEDGTTAGFTQGIGYGQGAPSSVLGGAHGARALQHTNTVPDGFIAMADLAAVPVGTAQLTATTSVYLAASGGEVGLAVLFFDSTGTMFGGFHMGPTRSVLPDVWTEIPPWTLSVPVGAAYVSIGASLPYGTVGRVARLDRLGVWAGSGGSWAMPGEPIAQPDDVVYDDVRDRTWATIDCQIVRVTCEHGGSVDQIPGVRARLGRLSATLFDPGRVLDPSSKTSPYELLTRPGVPVRVVAVEPGTGTLWPLWSGVAETFEHDLHDGTGELVASDLVALMTGFDVSSWSRPVESGQSRLLSALAIMPNPLPLRYDGLASTLSAAQFSGPLWSSVVEQTGEAEQSIVWVDQTGTLRRTDQTGLGAPVWATDCDDGVTPLIFTRLSTVTDDDVMTNLVTVERINLPESLKERVPLKFSEPTSVSYNGPHTLTNLRLPLLDDTALRSWAMRVLDLRAGPSTSLSGMTIRVDDVFPWTYRSVPAIVRQLSVGTILDVTLTSRGEPGRWLVAVASIRHTITPDVWDVEVEVVDGPRIAQNYGYDASASIYDETVYSRVEGQAGPSPAQIEAAILRVLADREATV